MNNDGFDFTADGNALLSFELLYLLQWLIEHETDSLKTLIEQATKNGFKKRTIQSNDFVELQFNDPNIQSSIVEFLGLMDSLLLEIESEHSVENVINRASLPALKQIDSTFCDDDLVQASVEKTTTRLKHHPNENPKETLCRELLRRWKPAKKTKVN